MKWLRAGVAKTIQGVGIAVPMSTPSRGRDANVVKTEVESGGAVATVAEYRLTPDPENAMLP